MLSIIEGIAYQKDVFFPVMIRQSFFSNYITESNLILNHGVPEIFVISGS